MIIKLFSYKALRQEIERKQLLNKKLKGFDYSLYSKSYTTLTYETTPIPKYLMTDLQPTSYQSHWTATTNIYTYR